MKKQQIFTYEKLEHQIFGIFTLKIASQVAYNCLTIN